MWDYMLTEIQQGIDELKMNCNETIRLRAIFS